MSHYRPQSTEVLDLPDTESIEEMEGYAQANEERLQEYATARY